MALSQKEKDRIIEEEQVRFEAKQALWAEHCAKHPRRGRWLWVVALAVLGYALWCHLACGGHQGACHAWSGKGGHKCGAHGQMMDPEAGQPIPKQP